MSDLTTAPAFLKDRANLILGASLAGERLQQLAESAPGPTVTLTTDAALELAEQFQRVTALLTVIHLAEARAAKERSAA